MEIVFLQKVLQDPIEQQFRYTRDTMDGLSIFIKSSYNICITHGNGPQVGDALHRMDLTSKQIPLFLWVCVAGTQGQMRYMIQQSLQNKLREMEIDREVVTMVAKVIVDKNDESLKTKKNILDQEQL